MAEQDPHRSLTDLIRRFPSVLAVLYELVLGKTLPEYARARLSSENLSIVETAELTGTDASRPPRKKRKPSSERSQGLYADNVVLLEDAKGKPNFAFVFEVQLRPEKKKRYRFPLYHHQARDRFSPEHNPKTDFPVRTMVLTVDEETAQWAAVPYSDDGVYFAPLVIGPHNLPENLDPDTARLYPVLAVLCAVAHRKSLRAASTAIDAALAQPPEESAILLSVLLHHLDNVEALRKMSTAFDNYTQGWAYRFEQETIANANKNAKEAAEKAVEEVRKQAAELASKSVEDARKQAREELALSMLQNCYPELSAGTIQALRAAPVDDLTKIVIAPQPAEGRSLQSCVLSLLQARVENVPDEAAEAVKAAGTGPLQAALVALLTQDPPPDLGATLAVLKSSGGPASDPGPQAG